MMMMNMKMKKKNKKKRNNKNNDNNNSNNNHDNRVNKDDNNHDSNQGNNDNEDEEADDNHDNDDNSNNQNQQQEHKPLMPLPMPQPAQAPTRLPPSSCSTTTIDLLLVTTEGQLLRTFYFHLSIFESCYSLLFIDCTTYYMLLSDFLGLCRKYILPTFVYHCYYYSY